MASVYPGALDTLPTNKLDITGQGSGDHAGHHNNLADAVNKIEAELGTNPSGTFATVVLRLAAMQLASEKGVANGYAALDSGGKVPVAQLPTVGSPAGIVEAYAGIGAPAGYLLCDGSAVSRTTYANLFTAIGTLYGAGDGSTTFNLPDYRGRTLAGQGTHADVDNIGDNDGSPLADRRPKHKHVVNDPTHTHTVGTGGNGSAQGVSTAAPTGNDGTARATSASATGVTVGPQTNSPTDGPAYAVVGWIIKT